MKRLSLLFGTIPLLAIVLASSAVQRGRAALPGTANPEDSAAVENVFTDPYFAVRYPLPPGWNPGPQPPRPSYAGYYVLNTPEPGHTKATILIAAQDFFFTNQSVDSAIDVTKKLAQDASDSDHTMPEPYRVTISGHTFSRLDLRGNPLSRIVLATDIRCHVLIFTFAAAEPEQLKKLAESLDRLSLGSDDAGSSAMPFPACMKGYATAENVLGRVEPVLTGPRLPTIPVRVIIGTDGRVKHTHVIRALPDQRKSIEDALAQWEFKPYRVNGAPVEIETGLVFECKPDAGQK